MIELDRVGKAYPARQGVTHAVGEVSLTIGAGGSCPSSAPRAAARARC